MATRGRKPNPDRKQRRWLLLRPQLWSWIDSEAEAAGTTVNAWIEAILAERQQQGDLQSQRMEAILQRMEALVGGDGR